METMRLTLIFLHVLIALFIIVNLHTDLITIHNASNRQTTIAAIIAYIFTILRISFYHTACILAVWFSHQYGAGLIRASGILLIGEFLQLLTEVIHKMFTADHLQDGEVYFIAIFYFLLLTAVLMTFRFARKLSKRQKNLMQVELLADTANEILIDNNL